MTPDDGQPVFLEDLQAGDAFALGSAWVSPEELARFSERFDPQPMHLDEERPIASGWFTASLAMEMIVRAAPFGSTPILGIGVDELRWPAPVRPGDVLSGSLTVVETRPSSSRPDRGTVRLSVELVNQASAVVFRMAPLTVEPRRER